MPKGLNQRTIVVCNPHLQYRYLLLPLIAAATTAVALFVFFLVLVGGLQEFAGSEEALGDAIGRVQLQMALAVGAVLIVQVVLIAWLGLLASHKVAGPIYQIRKSMAKVASGDMTVRIRLRNGDKLTEVADTFNEMMETVSARVGPDEPTGRVGEPIPAED
jgi:nitrogen fixation/metabolism regulation signal transduction histidine kinase